MFADKRFSAATPLHFLIIYHAIIVGNLYLYVYNLYLYVHNYMYTVQNCILSITLIQRECIGSMLSCRIILYLLFHILSVIVDMFFPKIAITFYEHCSSSIHLKRHKLYCQSYLKPQNSFSFSQCCHNNF